MRSAADSVERSMNQIEHTVSDTAREMGTDFQRGGERAEDALQEVGRQATRSMAQVAVSTNSAAESMSGRFSTAALAAKAALAGLALAAGAGLVALTGFGLKSAAFLEQVQIGFEALLGSGEQVKSFLEDIQKFAAATPFEFAGVADASRRILAFGTAVGITKDQVIPTITTIGNLVSVLGGTQESVDSVVRAFGQIASKGKLSQEELLQLAEALPGFNANAAIASALGVSVGESMDLISAGSVDAQTGINALLAGMAAFPGAAGAMEKQAQTLLGVFSTFKDTISIALTNAFQPVIPAIKESLAELTPILGQALNTLAPALGGLISALLPLLGEAVQALTPILTPILGILTDFISEIGGSLAPLGAALGGIVSAVAPLAGLVGQLFGTILSALAPLIQAFQPLIHVISGVLFEILLKLQPIIIQLASILGRILTPIIKLVADVFEQLGPPLAEIALTLIEALMPIIEALVPVIEELVKAFLPFLPIIVQLLQPILQLVTAFLPLVNIVAALLPVAAAIITPFAKLLAIIVELLANVALVPLIELIAKALTLVLSPLEGLVPQIEKFAGWLNGIDWGGVASAIGGALANAWQAVKNFFVNIGQFFVDLYNSARSALTRFAEVIRDRINFVVAFFSELPGRIMAFISDLPNRLFNAGRDLVIGLWNGISSLGGWLGQQVRNFVNNNVIGPAKRFLGIASPSTVFRDEVGKEIGAGMALGIRDSITDIRSALGGVSPSTLMQGGPTFGNIIINVNAAGMDPEQQRRLGPTISSDILDALQRTRSVSLAVKTA